MKVNRKSKTDRFRNSHSCEAEKNLEKGAIKNEKHKIKRITARRGKSRERKRTRREYPIMRSTAWRERYYRQSVGILKRRKRNANLNFGKPKGKNYNLIKNLEI